jgi:hypothetical protein
MPCGWVVVLVEVIVGPWTTEPAAVPAGTVSYPRERCKQPRVFAGGGCTGSVGRGKVDELHVIPGMAIRARA